MERHYQKQVNIKTKVFTLFLPLILAEVKRLALMIISNKMIMMKKFAHNFGHIFTTNVFHSIFSDNFLFLWSRVYRYSDE